MGKETDDHQLNWRNSLRPLDPGILTDKENKKKERYIYQAPLLTILTLTNKGEGCKKRS